MPVRLEIVWENPSGKIVYAKLGWTTCTCISPVVFSLIISYWITAWSEGEEHVESLQTDGQTDMYVYDRRPEKLTCLEFFVPLENFLLIWRRHHCRWRAANFDLCLALMAVAQWMFFSVPRLLWHGASVYNGHLRGPVTLTPNAECLAVERSLPV